VNSGPPELGSFIAGIKTGYTEASGYNLVSSVRRS